MLYWLINSRSSVAAAVRCDIFFLRWEIARRAGVPIVPAYLDFGKKEIGLGETIWPTDDFEADLHRVRSNFRKEMAKRPNQFIEDGASAIQRDE